MIVLFAHASYNLDIHYIKRELLWNQSVTLESGDKNGLLTAIFAAQITHLFWLSGGSRGVL
jgi:hypothetical protein